MAKRFFFNCRLKGVTCLIRKHLNSKSLMSKWKTLNIAPMYSWGSSNKKRNFKSHFSLCFENVLEINTHNPIITHLLIFCVLPSNLCHVYISSLHYRIHIISYHALIKTTLPSCYIELPIIIVDTSVFFWIDTLQFNDLPGFNFFSLFLLVQGILLNTGNNKDNKINVFTK